MEQLAETVFDVIRILTPLIQLVIMILVGVFGWFFNRLVRQLESKIESRFCELSGRVGKLEQEVEALKREEHQFQTQTFQKFVSSETFYREVGSTKRIMDQVFARINELSGTVNQMIGAFKERFKPNA